MSDLLVRVAFILFVAAFTACSWSPPLFKKVLRPLFVLQAQIWARSNDPEMLERHVRKMRIMCKAWSVVMVPFGLAAFFG